MENLDLSEIPVIQDISTYSATPSLSTTNIYSTYTAQIPPATSSRRLVNEFPGKNANLNQPQTTDFSKFEGFLQNNHSSSNNNNNNNNTSLNHNASGTIIPTSNNTIESTTPRSNSIRKNRQPIFSAASTGTSHIRSPSPLASATANISSNQFNSTGPIDSNYLRTYEQPKSSQQSHLPLASNPSNFSGISYAENPLQTLNYQNNSEISNITTQPIQQGEMIRARTPAGRNTSKADDETTLLTNNNSTISQNTSQIPNSNGLPPVMSRSNKHRSTSNSCRMKIFGGTSTSHAAATTSGTIVYSEAASPIRVSAKSEAEFQSINGEPSQSARNADAATSARELLSQNQLKNEMMNFAKEYFASITANVEATQIKVQEYERNRDPFLNQAHTPSSEMNEISTKSAGEQYLQRLGKQQMQLQSRLEQLQQEIRTARPINQTGHNSEGCLTLQAEQRLQAVVQNIEGQMRQSFDALNDRCSTLAAQKHSYSHGGSSENTVQLIASIKARANDQEIMAKDQLATLKISLNSYEKILNSKVSEEDMKSETSNLIREAQVQMEQRIDNLRSEVAVLPAKIQQEFLSSESKINQIEQTTAQRIDSFSQSLSSISKADQDNSAKISAQQDTLARLESNLNQLHTLHQNLIQKQQQLAYSGVSSTGGSKANSIEIMMQGLTKRMQALAEEHRDISAAIQQNNHAIRRNLDENDDLASSLKETTDRFKALSAESKSSLQILSSQFSSFKDFTSLKIKQIQEQQSTVSHDSHLNQQPTTSKQPTISQPNSSLHKHLGEQKIHSITHTGGPAASAAAASTNQIGSISSSQTQYAQILNIQSKSSTLVGNELPANLDYSFAAKPQEQSIISTANNSMNPTSKASEIVAGQTTTTTQLSSEFDAFPKITLKLNSKSSVGQQAGLQPSLLPKNSSTFDSKLIQDNNNNKATPFTTTSSSSASPSMGVSPTSYISSQPQYSNLPPLPKNLQLTPTTFSNPIYQSSPFSLTQPIGQNQNPNIYPRTTLETAKFKSERSESPSTRSSQPRDQQLILKFPDLSENSSDEEDAHKRIQSYNSPNQVQKLKEIKENLLQMKGQDKKKQKVEVLQSTQQQLSLLEDEPQEAAALNKNDATQSSQVRSTVYSILPTEQPREHMSKYVTYSPLEQQLLGKPIIIDETAISNENNNQNQENTSENQISNNHSNIYKPNSNTQIFGSNNFYNNASLSNKRVSLSRESDPINFDYIDDYSQKYSQSSITSQQSMRPTVSQTSTDNQKTSLPIATPTSNPSSSFQYDYSSQNQYQTLFSKQQQQQQLPSQQLKEQLKPLVAPSPQKQINGQNQLIMNSPSTGLGILGNNSSKQLQANIIDNATTSAEKEANLDDLEDFHENNDQEGVLELGSSDDDADDQFYYDDEDNHHHHHSKKSTIHPETRSNLLKSIHEEDEDESRFRFSNAVENKKSNSVEQIQMPQQQQQLKYSSSQQQLQQPSQIIIQSQSTASANITKVQAQVTALLELRNESNLACMRDDVGYLKDASDFYIFDTEGRMIKTDPETYTHLQALGILSQF